MFGAMFNHRVDGCVVPFCVLLHPRFGIIRDNEMANIGKAAGQGHTVQEKLKRKFRLHGGKNALHLGDVAASLNVTNSIFNPCVQNKAPLTL